MEPQPHAQNNLGPPRSLTRREGRSAVDGVAVSIDQASSSSFVGRRSVGCFPARGGNFSLKTVHDSRSSFAVGDAGELSREGDGESGICLLSGAERPFLHCHLPLWRRRRSERASGCVNLATFRWKKERSGDPTPDSNFESSDFLSGGAENCACECESTFSKNLRCIIRRAALFSASANCKRVRRPCSHQQGETSAEEGNKQVPDCPNNERVD